MKKLYILLISFLISDMASAQCYDDYCIDAPAQTTPIPGCCTGTTVGATPSFSGTYGCATLTGGQDVWMTFMAPSNGFLTIDFTQITIAGTVNIVVFDSFSNSDNCATLNAGGVIAAIECFDAATPPNPMQLNAVQTGERYFILISSPPGSTPGSFTICLDVITPTGGMDCPDATPLCTTDPISLPAIGSGPGAISGGSSMEDISLDSNGPDDGLVGSCWGNGVYGGGEVNSQWYVFTAGSNGTLQMAIEPQDLVVNCAGPSVTSADYDWMILDVSTTTGNLYTCNINGSDFGGVDSASIVACDWSGQYGVTGFAAAGPSAFGFTGTGQGGCQSTDDFLGSSTTAWNNYDINLTAGNTYALVISNYTGTTAGFDLQWGGSATFGVQPVTLAPIIINGCDVNTSITSPLSGGSLIWSYDYEIDWGDGTITTAGSTSLSHSYATPGTYTITVLVSDPVGCLDGYSESVVTNCLGLPVDLVDFSGVNNGRENQLYWWTASEANSDYFIVERSTNTSNWTVLGTIPAAGNTQETRSYSLNDNNPAKVTYYRLKQVDIDGTVHTYYTISLSRKLENTDLFSELSPNPANDHFQFFYTGSDHESAISVSVYSSDGRLCNSGIFNPSESTMAYVVDCSSLKSGNYIVVINQGNTKEIKQLVIF